MKLPDPVKQLIVRYVAKYPAVVGEDAWREWIHRLCEQLAFTFPADGWGHKGAPHSKDCIALKSPTSLSRGRLVSATSLPFSLNATSSMHSRATVMPRPDPASRLSGSA
jgi:hypothetical protein